MRVIITRFLMFIFFMAGGLLANAQKTYDLTIVVPNVKNTKGNISMGLFNKESAFPKEGKEYKKAQGKASGNFTYTFKNLPEGEYAIAVMHDENANGKCDMNMLGIPKEGYGFSNNFKPKFSAPTFSQVKFRLDKSKTQRISLIY